MPRPHATLARALVLPAIASALVISMLAAPGSAGARPDPSNPRSDRAEEALEKVEELLPDPVGQGKAGLKSKSGQPGKGGGQDPAAPEEGADLTMALRDLAALAEDLPPAEQAAAERYLARPTNNEQSAFHDKYGSAERARPVCREGKVCVHYVTTGRHKAHKDFAEQVADAIEKSYDKYVSQLGYRAPLPDSMGHADQAYRPLPDVYLADLGDEQVFGYATVDGAKKRAGKHRGFPGYMVLDNDYVKTQYGSSQTPTNFMKVTAAHEYFHLVQFAYDWWEDPWFMEATATWAEELVFDGINDNRAFLRSRNSPLTNPRDSMDWGDPLGNPYGDWLFFAYVTQRWGKHLVRQMWRQAANKYSIKAVRRVVANQGPKWNNTFRRYAAANRRPKASYDEGRHYPKARPYWKKMMRKRKRLRIPSVRLDHLTAASFRVKAERGMWRRWRLQIRVDGQPRWRGGTAIVTWKKRNGVVKRTGIGLGKNGIGKQNLPFGRKKVRWVEVTVVNASTRFRNCNTGSALSCEGWPKDQNRKTRVWFKAHRP